MDLSPDRIALALTWYVVLLFSLSFHEAAHAWTAHRMGDDTALDQGRVSLNPFVHVDPVGTVLMPMLQIFVGGIPFLGWAKPTPVQAGNFRQGSLARGQVLVAGAGPVSNMVLVVFFTVLLFLADQVGLPDPHRRTVFALLAIGVQLNVALAVFNLVPVPPLDGSWVASWGLPRQLGSAYDRIVEPLGPWLLLILLIPISRFIVHPITSFTANTIFNLVL